MDNPMLNILNKLILYLNKQKSILFIILSLCLHLLSYKSIKKDYVKTVTKKVPNNQIKFSIHKTKKTKKEKINLKDKKIIETPLLKTKAPKKTKFLGKNNHIAKKQQRVKKRTQAKGLDPKRQKSSQSKGTNIFTAKKSPTTKISTDSDGHLSIINKSLKQIDQQSYTDFIDDSSIAAGNFIDINTKEYKYISYFTKMRKSIELAWEYPLRAARKGWQGKVKLSFVIYENGYITNIKVLKSSGYNLLDKAVVKAIEIASPFPPLPKSLAINNLPITGTFNYILGQFANSY
jgi:TonB family protein